MKYTKLLPFLALCLSLTACTSYEKLYEAGSYDQVVQKLSPRICSGHIRLNQVNLVASSFHKANQIDHERIQTLKASGKPEAWPEIYQRYASMKGRNDALDCFPENIKQGIGYASLDLDDELSAARNKAESYLVAKSDMLLNSGNKSDAKEADKLIEQLSRTNPQNKHLQELRTKSMLHQAEHALLRFENPYRVPVPQDFAATVLQFDANELEKASCPIDLSKQRKTDYDLIVRIKLLNKSWTPERLDAVTFEEKNNGKTVKVTDQTQSKSMTIKGQIEYYDIDKGHIRTIVPFEVTSSFKHNFATIEGDREACSEQTLLLLKEKQLPFPNDDSLLIDAAKELNNMIAKELTK